MDRFDLIEPRFFIRKWIHIIVIDKLPKNLGSLLKTNTLSSTKAYQKDKNIKLNIRKLKKYIPNFLLTKLLKKRHMDKNSKIV